MSYKHALYTTGVCTYHSALIVYISVYHIAYTFNCTHRVLINMTSHKYALIRHYPTPYIHPAALSMYLVK